MEVKKIPKISGLAGAVAAERIYGVSLHQYAATKCWSIAQLIDKIAGEYIRHISEWGPHFFQKSDKFIRDGVKNISFDLIALSRNINIDERKVFINILSRAVELHHEPTAQHQERVMKLCLELARMIGVKKQDQHDLELAGALHDLGKIVVPVQLLDKIDSLTPSENDLVKRVHLLFGYFLLDSISFLRGVARIVGYNHVFDGYQPAGFSKKKMPLEAQILSAVDYYDALTDPRRYRQSGAFSPADALRLVLQRDYDRRILEALTSVTAGV